MHKDILSFAVKLKDTKKSELVRKTETEEINKYCTFIEYDTTEKKNTVWQWNKENGWKYEK